MGYVWEAGGNHKEVAEVAAEGEGGAGGSLQDVPLTADEGGGVAAAHVKHGGDYVGEYHIGEVVHGGPKSGRHAGEIQICFAVFVDGGIDFYTVLVVFIFFLSCFS